MRFHIFCIFSIKKMNLNFKDFKTIKLHVYVIIM